MREIKLEVHSIGEEKPKDGQECWVLSQRKGYTTMQVYNEYYSVWDDATGDDYDFDVTETDLWMALPNLSEYSEME